MSTLTEQFPAELEIAGKRYAIHSDFRTALACDRMIKETREELTGANLLELLRRFYKKPRVFTKAHIDKMFWFFSCGREKEKRSFPKKIAGINNNCPFDFEEDADLIYAGFLQQYGIDLQKSQMHWWKFMILLENFGTDTRLSRIMEYRTKDTASKFLSKDEREFYKAMQKYYSLERKNIQADDRMLRIEEALMKGEDISRLLRGD